MTVSWCVTPVRFIRMRESYLSRLHDVVQAPGFTVSKCKRDLVELLVLLRKLSLAIVEAIDFRRKHEVRVKEKGSSHYHHRHSHRHHQYHHHHAPPPPPPPHHRHGITITISAIPSRSPPTRVPCLKATPCISRRVGVPSYGTARWTTC
jgi:hypothetical protein